ncbi:MAG: flagellar basal body P-ring formation protein FlgA [Planctomycetaceae bacterium]|nr:flagellar basal body P-ring formation protein FlgA [Planctomycetaceae bacterium]
MDIPRTLRINICLAAALLAASGGVAMAQQSGASVAVEVRLKPTAMIESSNVVLRDIADIRCADPQLVSALGELDLEQLGDDEATCEIDAALVQLRLRLAGVNIRSMTLTGAEKVIVARRQLPAVSDAAFAAQLRLQIADQYAVDPADLQVTMLTSLQDAWKDQNDTAASCDALLPEALPLGRRSVLVRCLSAGQLMTTRQVTLDIKLEQNALVAQADLPAGHSLTAEDIAVERRMLSTLVDVNHVEEAVSRQLVRHVRRGAVLGEFDFARRPIQDSMLVKSRDTVRVSAVKGSLKVVLQVAEATQSGKLGDRILLKNIDSQRIISGIVVGPGEVEIDLGPATVTRPTPTQISSRPGSGTLR